MRRSRAVPRAFAKKHVRTFNSPVGTKKQPLPDIGKAARHALERDVVWQARLWARRLSAPAHQSLEATGLRHARFMPMCPIASATNGSVNALAQRAGVDQSTVSVNLKYWSKRNWRN